MTTPFLTPFIEAPHVRQPLPALSEMSGSDTSVIDHLRQGISIRNDRDRFDGPGPKLEAEVDGHEISVVTYGQSDASLVDVAFEEIPRFDAASHIQQSSDPIFPLIIDNASLIDPEKMGGFIEPFSIPARAWLNSVTEFEIHDIKGHLADGNEDTFRKTSLITQFTTDFNEVAPTDVYIDAVAKLGVEGGSIDLGGLFPDDEFSVKPFDETVTAAKMLLPTGLTGVGSSDITTALTAMTGAATDSGIPFNARSMGTGFVVADNNIHGSVSLRKNVIGFDSIAFGGLKR